jgi:hypothetical protein
VDKKHLLVSLVSMVGLLVVFVIGCRLVGVADAQPTPISSTLMGFAVMLGYLIWGKADTDSKVRAVEQKTDTAATEAQAAKHVAAETRQEVRIGNNLTAETLDAVKPGGVELHGPRPYPRAAGGDGPGGLKP